MELFALMVYVVANMAFVVTLMHIVKMVVKANVKLVQHQQRQQQQQHLVVVVVMLLGLFLLLF
jgi:hypothetical protein